MISREDYALMGPARLMQLCQRLELELEASAVYVEQLKAALKGLLRDLPERKMSRADDIDAVLKRANRIAARKDSYIFGDAYHVVCRKLREHENRPGLCFSGVGQDDERLLALAFALTLLGVGTAP